MDLDRWTQPVGFEVYIDWRGDIVCVHPRLVIVCTMPQLHVDFFNKMIVTMIFGLFDELN